MHVHIASVADDPIVSKDFPANVTCRRTKQQRIDERNLTTTKKSVIKINLASHTLYEKIGKTYLHT